MAASDYAGTKILDLILRGVPYTPPTRVWVSLHTGPTGVDGSNEVTPEQWPIYTRVDPANGGAIATGFTAAAGKLSENTGLIEFLAMDGDVPINITHFGLWDAQTNGNFIAGDPVDEQLLFLPTDAVQFKPGDLKVTVR